MKTIHSQKGMTGIGWMLVIALILFFAYTVMTLLPVYLESYNVGSVTKSLADEKDLTPKLIKSLLLKRLDINMATSVAAEDIYITRETNGFLVEIEYEVREPFIANIDLVLYFKKSIEIPIFP